MQSSKSTYATEADFHMNNSVWWVPEQVKEKVYLVMDRHFFFYLFLSVLGLHWCMGFSLAVRSGVALVAVQALQWLLLWWSTDSRVCRLW